MESGWIFQIQKFSTHDGPGIRTTVFCKGCPLRCPWCHNPEGLTSTPQIEWDRSVCIGCGLCTACVHHNFTGNQLVFDRSACTACGQCASQCPTGALKQVGQRMTVEEVLVKVRRDRAFYGKDGGMTISGGEPLAQPNFTRSLLEAAQAEGIHTAMESAGYSTAACFSAVLPHLSLLLLDYKVTGEEEHLHWTGVSQKQILDNLALVDRAGVPTILRCPIIPGVNDTEKHFSGICAVAAQYRCIQRVELEPYHPMGRGKLDRFGMENTPLAAFSAPVPTPDTIQIIRTAIQKSCVCPVSIS